MLCIAACGQGTLREPGADTDAQPFVEQDGGLVADGTIEPDSDSPDSASPDIASPDSSSTTTDAAGQPPGAGCPRVLVSTKDGQPAKVRPTPAYSGAPVATVLNKVIVTVLAVVQKTNTWYQVKSAGQVGFVSGKQVQCTTKKKKAFYGFYLPFPCGKKIKVSQGNKTSFSHNGTSAYAYDFSLGVGTRMIAMAPGTVVHVYNKTRPGDPCYSGGGPSCITKANVVWVKHPDGTRTIYAHLSHVKVSLNQKVTQGQLLGKSGSSGYSTGPHAHIGRMKSCCQTIPLKFNDVPGAGVPKTGDHVVSGNCP